MIRVRLIAVELRRAVDTPAPRWAIGASILVGIALTCLQPNGPSDTFADFMSVASIALPLLAGLLAVMAFTSDWATRAALITFALSPRRSHVLAARYCAVIIITVGLVIALHVVGAATYAALRPDAAGSIIDASVGRQLGSMVGLVVSVTLTSIAVAGLVLRTALALVVAVFVPFSLTIGFAFLPAGADWLGPYSFSSWLADPTIGWWVADRVGVGPAVTSFLLWTAAPCVLGWIRQLRTEPR
jgi:hypothetical protein